MRDILGFTNEGLFIYVLVDLLCTISNEMNKNLGNLRHGFWLEHPHLGKSLVDSPKSVVIARAACHYFKTIFLVVSITKQLPK